VIAGIHTIDSQPGPEIRLPDDEFLDRFRNWKRIFYRTRGAT
jgi:hypothetical protein